jgi:hypothetical protein
MAVLLEVAVVELVAWVLLGLAELLELVTVEQDCLAR